MQGGVGNYSWLGSTNCRLGRYEEASPCLEKASEIMDDTIPNAMRQANNYWLGKTLFELGRYEEALIYLEKATRLIDDHENPQWLLDCLQQFKLCLDKVGDGAKKEYKAGIVTPKTHRLTKLFFGDENKCWERVLGG